MFAVSECVQKIRFVFTQFVCRISANFRKFVWELVRGGIVLVAPGVSKVIQENLRMKEVMGGYKTRRDRSHQTGSLLESISMVQLEAPRQSHGNDKVFQEVVNTCNSLNNLGTTTETEMGYLEHGTSRSLKKIEVKSELTN